MSDVLLISKAEVGKSERTLAPMDLEKFCQDLVLDVQLAASENHNSIFTIQGNRIIAGRMAMQNPQMVSLDEKMLRHILTNLLFNAVKYSPTGGIIRFELFYVQGEVVFRIQDEGIGIPEADQENLFNSFQRGSNVGKIPGSGLGLAIVKHYVDLHGGEISFVSKLRVGTTFIVSLPIEIN